MVFYEEKNLLFSASSDHDVIVWNMKLMKCEKILVGHRLEVNKVLLDKSKEKKYLFSCSTDKSVIVWSLNNYCIAHHVWGHYSAITYFSLSNDNTELITCSKDGSVGIWSLTYNKNILGLLNFIQFNMHNKLA